MQAASHGGEVPVNDARKVPRSLPVTFVREMRERGVRYSRRVPRKNASLEVGWEHQFSTTEKSVVERHLAGEGITYHWEADDLLRFWFERPVFRTYRDEEVWFNQLSESNAEWWLCHPVFQAMGITREMVQSDTAYGDGEPFPEEVTAMVRGAIWQTTELVKLEPTDILVLDNFIAQDGRLSYHGTRKHHVALIKDPLM